MGQGGISGCDGVGRHVVVPPGGEPRLHQPVEVAHADPLHPECGLKVVIGDDHATVDLRLQVVRVYV